MNWELLSKLKFPDDYPGRDCLADTVEEEGGKFRWFVTWLPKDYFTRRINKANELERSTDTLQNEEPQVRQ